MGRHRFPFFNSRLLRFRILLLCLLFGFGCAGRQQTLNPGPAIRRAQIACDKLAFTRLKAPIMTKVASSMKRIKTARKKHKQLKALRLARKLRELCLAELEQRVELRQLVTSVMEEKDRLKPRLVDRFYALVRGGHYSLAILCGEGLLQRHPKRCQTIPSEALGTKDKRAPIIAEPLSEQTAPVLSFHQLLSSQEGDGSSRPPSVETSVQVEQASRTRWPWVVIGSGTGLLIGGAILAGMAQYRFDRLEEHCPSCTQQQIDDGKKMAISADVLFGVGAAAVVGGGAWYIWERFLKKRPSKKASADQRVVLSPFGLFVEGEF